MRVALTGILAVVALFTWLAEDGWKIWMPVALALYVFSRIVQATRR